jgi:hypothetical protein
VVVGAPETDAEPVVSQPLMVCGRTVDAQHSVGASVSVGVGVGVGVCVRVRVRVCVLSDPDPDPVLAAAARHISTAYSLHSRRVV